MSLNCWTCPILQRTNSSSDVDFSKEKDITQFCCVRISRSLSGNMSPQPYEQLGKDPGIPTKKMKKAPRRFNTFDTISYSAMGFEGNGNDEPRLVRSSGMRRDWSMEDLRGKRG
ncbi:Detected protein of unknown function [Hibiscus syriacus]|uniref:Uncharacterized protein n=1 Tax=Hibiscus syriacus TaxID=106335 RepID=A0A6A3C5Q8_HIBSY|nr:uncharacterized protein LOC120206598 [Hibiscus syriacus]KAE8722542.1 Detected protein of unknown function [Hibiscus syriacus]